MDSRHIAAGRLIPTSNYCDQPYVIKTDDGAWLCTVTTGSGHEGTLGQHVVSMRSLDQGTTWSDPVCVEPPDGPEASYSVLLKVPSGRVYCFYNHNTDNLRELQIAGGKPLKRVDLQGHYVFKYSDDHGRTWSPRRYEISVRAFSCDLHNAYQGKVRQFWNVGVPVRADDSVILPLHKIAPVLVGEKRVSGSEGAFLRSDNLLSESDPEKIQWRTLPDGDLGLRTPPGGGRIAEEHSLVSMTDGSLHTVYRTSDGFPAHAYSRDGGSTWTAPDYMPFCPRGRLMKHPRAAVFHWRCGEGKYLCWFHNHGGRFAREGTPGVDPYEDRNPAWLCAGVERDSPDGRVIHWSEPEIVLYDDDPFVRISYPDLLEENGQFFITETQKNIARSHPLDPRMIERLFGQFAKVRTIAEGAILDWTPAQSSATLIPAPTLPLFCRRDNSRADYGQLHLRTAFTLELWLALNDLKAGQVVLDGRTGTGKGILLRTTERETLAIALSDGRTECSWECDPGVLKSGELQHVVIVVDAGPHIITFIVNGQLCDGGEHRQFGWGRFSPHLRHANGDTIWRLATSMNGTVARLRVYDRAFMTSDAIGNWRAGV